MILMTLTWYILYQRHITNHSPNIPHLSPTLDSTQNLDTLSVSTNKRVFGDIRHLEDVDLYADEYNDEVQDIEEDEIRSKKFKGRFGIFWRVWEAIV